MSFSPDPMVSQTQFGPAVQNPAVGKRVVAIALRRAVSACLLQLYGAYSRDTKSSIKGPARCCEGFS